MWIGLKKVQGFFMNYSHTSTKPDTPLGFACATVIFCSLTPSFGMDLSQGCCTANISFSRTLYYVHFIIINVICFDVLSLLYINDVPFRICRWCIKGYTYLLTYVVHYWLL